MTGTKRYIFARVVFAVPFVVHACAGPPCVVDSLRWDRGYFETLGLTLTRGRAFADADGTAGHEVGIVNQRLVSVYFAGNDPLGHRIKLVSDPPTDHDPPWITIVGVSPTVRSATCASLILTRSSTYPIASRPRRP